MAEQYKTQKGRIKAKGHTKDAWDSSYVLLSREVAYETDTGYYKIGDGITPWGELPYYGGPISNTNEEGNEFIYLNEDSEKSFVYSSDSIVDDADYGDLIFGFENQAIGKYNIALGNSNTVGNKAYYISSIDMENKKIYLTKTQVTIPSLTEHEFDASILEDNTFYAVGDVFSIISEFHYPACATIAAIDNNRVITYEGDLPFSIMYEDSGIDGNTFYVASKPEIGCVAIRSTSMGVGLSNKIGGSYSFGAGYANIAHSNFGGALGRNNETGYAATAINSYNKAYGEHSFAFGNRNLVTYNAKYSAAGGYNTIAGSSRQFVIGEFNIEDKDDKYSFIVGNGDHVIRRSNSFTLDRDGNAWFAGNISLGLNNDKLLKNSDIYGVNKNIQLGEKNTLPTIENDTTKEANIAIGGSNTINTKWATTIGRNNTTTSEVSVLIGYQNRANVTAGYNILVGTRNEATMGSTFAFGKDLITNRYEQTVVGRRNATDDQAIFIIGNGLNTNSRANAFVIKHNNEIYAAGNIYSDNKKLATEDYVSERLEALLGTGAPETLNTIGELAAALNNDPNFKEALATKDYVDEQIIKPTATIIDNVLVIA